MEYPDFSLEGKRALVTGASQGIGRHVALSLAHAGVDVVVSSLPQQELSEVAEQIRAEGHRAWAITADLAYPDQVKALGEQALEVAGGIDILVNNAGISILESALETSQEAWDATMAVNLRAPMLLSQVLAPRMMEAGGGRIIMMSSQAGIIGLHNHAAYCASKAGLINLTRVLALEWSGSGLTVNAIAPTVIMTPMAEQAWADPVARQAMLERIPRGRFGYPLDVSGAVLFLASPAADLITGHTLVVDGGYTAA